MASEITEEEEEEDDDREEEKARIRKIISYQKSLYYSSSSSSSISSSTSSFSSPQRRTSSSSSSLFDLMRDGSTSLRRLFDMEHTSLGNYFKDYSVSPTIKPILLWGSESDNEAHDDPWAGVKKQTAAIRSSQGSFGGGDDEDDGGGFVQPRKMREKRSGRRRLSRKKSYKRLPGFSFWRCGAVRFRLRLMRRLRIVIRSKKL